MKTKTRTVFVCRACGGESPKWSGRCPACEEWNSLTERREEPEPTRPRTGFSSAVSPLSGAPVAPLPRRATGLGEFDRILGGGVVPGSLVLLGGPPGIGKSTLMLQAADRLARPDFTVLYVSGEESPDQVRGRAARIGVSNPSLLLVSETDLARLLELVEEGRPGAVVVDSVQTVQTSGAAGGAGSVTQIRECAAELVRLAKGRGVSVFLLGHVTKQGDLAGPRLLEHMVDTVLYFETERQDAHRILRAVKNRFGPTNEIGVFEMTGTGLREIANPSSLFLGAREGPAPAGTAVLAALEGARPLLVEIQALVARTLFGMPRRQVSGVDPARAALLIAVLDRRCGLRLESQDVYLQAAGGLEVREPAADLAACAAKAGACLDRPLAAGMVWLGEVGLGGELRPVPQTAERLGEAAKLGFRTAVVPKGAARGPAAAAGFEVRACATLQEALRRGGLEPGT